MPSKHDFERQKHPREHPRIEFIKNDLTCKRRLFGSQGRPTSERQEALENHHQPNSVPALALQRSTMTISIPRCAFSLGNMLAILYWTGEPSQLRTTDKLRRTIENKGHDSGPPRKRPKQGSTALFAPLRRKYQIPVSTGQASPGRSTGNGMSRRELSAGLPTAGTSLWDNHRYVHG